MEDTDGNTSSTAVPMYSSGAVAKLRFCLLPHKCAISNKRLWFKTAYRIQEKYYSIDYCNPEKKIIYTWWVDKHEYILAKLKA